MKVRIITFALCFIGILATAQTKVGSINSEYIVGLMPETKKVLSLLNDYAKRLDSSYQIRLTEYQTKVDAFQKLGKDISDNFKKIKIEELADMEKKLQLSQQNGSKLLQLKKGELMRPLYKKLREAIAGVAKAEGYTQILTTSGNEFAYIDERYDLTKKVMTKLGVKIPEEDKK